MTEVRRIAIVGSREGVSREAVDEFVSKLPTLGTVIVSGGAAGADTYAAEAAEARGIRVVIIRPNWKKYGRSAGFRRNKEIVLAADDVVAFWDGISKGTANTLKHAIELRRPLAVFSPWGQLIRFVHPGEPQQVLLTIPRQKPAGVRGPAQAATRRHRSPRALRRQAERDARVHD